MAIDIFCGCGGTSQGLKEAGFNIVAGIENDELAAHTYKVNHSKTKLWDIDIRELSPDMLLNYHKLKKGRLDLLTGCPPCQAFSSIRRLNGKKRIYDKESKDLIFNFLAFVEGLYPKVVMIENVPQLIEDYRFSKVVNHLRSLGYDGQPKILNAADFGVPQRRRRMVYIASRIGDLGNFAPLISNENVTVRDAIASLPLAGHSGDALHDLPEKRSKRVSQLIKMIPKDGGSRSALGEEAQLSCHKRCSGFNDVYGRMSWDGVAPTITGGCVSPSKGRFLHPEQNRAITLREAALLQTFPQDYFFSTSKGKYKTAEMIGNAFPPRFVRFHAAKIREHIKLYRQN